MQQYPRVICLGLNKTGTSTLLNVFLKVLDCTHNWKNDADVNNVPFKNKEIWWRYQNKKLQSLYRANKIDKLLKEAAIVPILKDDPWFKGDLYLKTHKAFPNTKFILTLRDSEDWYNSLYKWCYTIPQDFKDKKNETAILIRIKKRCQRYNAHLGGKSIEDKEALIAGYNEYNNKIINYFKDKENFYILKVPEDLNWKTVMNISGLTLPVMKEKLKDLDLDLSKPIEEWEFPHFCNSSKFIKYKLPESKQTVYIVKSPNTKCIKCKNITE